MEVARTEIRRNFYTQLIVSDWNKLPSEDKRAKNVKAFKKMYKCKFSTTDGEP
jgi:hypothetical protein